MRIHDNYRAHGANIWLAYGLRTNHLSDLSLLDILFHNAHTMSPLFYGHLVYKMF